MAQTFAVAVFNGEKWNAVRDMEIVVTEGVVIMKRIYDHLVKRAREITVEDMVDFILKALKKYFTGE